MAFFIPSELLAPRDLIRRLYMPVFFYFVGLTTGMYAHARGEGERITYISIGVMLVLLLLRWWSGASAKPQAAGSQ
ncbi:MAG TPA: hypothetical protein VH518_09145 [Tepidisphaeraceae bacterium]